MQKIYVNETQRANNIGGTLSAFELIQGKSFVDLGSRGEQSGRWSVGYFISLINYNVILKLWYWNWIYRMEILCAYAEMASEPWVCYSGRGTDRFVEWMESNFDGARNNVNIIVHKKPVLCQCQHLRRMRFTCFSLWLIIRPYCWRSFTKHRISSYFISWIWHFRPSLSKHAKTNNHDMPMHKFCTLGLLLRDTRKKPISYRP